MALTDESNGNGFYMPVAPAYGGGYGNGGFGFGGDWAWILLLLLIGGGGWGMGGFGGGMMWPMMMGGMAGGWDLYPWLNNSQHISDGFRDQFLNTQIGDLRTDVNRGFGDVQNSLCAGFAGVNAGIANAASQAEISANARQMANMQQGFGIQSAIRSGFSQTAAGTADLNYTIATEACADRAAVQQGIQTVLDKLCQLELDNYKTQLANAQRDNAALQNQVILATERADRTAQTGTIIDGVYNRLASCPVDTTPVYGRQMIFQCPQQANPGCGCSGNGFMN